jgi:hypothetical protein
MLQQLIDLYPHLLGYILATVGAHFIISPIMEYMWRSAGSRPVDRPRAWHSKLLGMIERAMFVGSIQLKKPEFIGVWLVFKVASQWARWADAKTAGQKSKSGEAHGREFYNIFLFGNALSIVFAAVCAMMIKWLSAGDILFSLVVALTVLVGSVILVIYVKRKAKETTGYAE